MINEYRLNIEFVATGKQTDCDWMRSRTDFLEQHYRFGKRDDIRIVNIERREVTYSAPVVVGIEEVR